jgi:phosphatidylinositol N-acetylglucosaminyltransferase subunit Q
MLALLWYYPSFFVDLVNTVGSRLHLDQVLKSTYWLFGNPAGFKPNINLSHFLGNFVLELIFVWNHVTSALTKVKLLIVFYISSVGVLGFSVQLAATNDILFFCSFGLFCVYTVFAFIYSYTLNLLSTLLKLFRGRKYNTIRKRDDSTSFEISELYLGVLIVTLSIFLLPTVAIFYYYCFISIIISVMVLQLVLIVLQTLATNFPYFLLFWSIKEPYSLPNSLRMKVSPENGRILIEALPVNKGAIFKDLVTELKLLFDKKFLVQIISAILRGENLFHMMRGFLNILARVKSLDNNR